MTERDYWEECIGQAACDCDAYDKLTREQIVSIANDARIAHEHYYMFHYEPPASDRLSVIEDEYKAKIKRIEEEQEEYRRKSEAVFRRAYHLHDDTLVYLDNDGYLRWDR